MFVFVLLANGKKKVPVHCAMADLLIGFVFG